MGTYVGGDMKYPEVNEMWYDIDGSFKVMSDDKGASEMEDWAEATDKIHLYLIHPVSQLEFVNLIELEANAFEAQYNVNHKAQFEAQSNVEELGSDEGNASVTSLEDSNDDHILEGEVFIYEIVDSEPKKKSKNKGGRLKRQNVTNPKGKGIVKVNNEIEESDHESRDDL
ncbi:alcohol-forming fatty acyl-CoA reductase [Trifolium repens]|nr:alcohol-forming fatty acyl-CoA reductase [Trifolium repens]